MYSVHPLNIVGAQIFVEKNVLSKNLVKIRKKSRTQN